MDTGHTRHLRFSDQPGTPPKTAAELIAALNEPLTVFVPNTSMDDAAETEIPRVVIALTAVLLWVGDTWNRLRGR